MSNTISTTPTPSQTPSLTMTATSASTSTWPEHPNSVERTPKMEILQGKTNKAAKCGAKGAGAKRRHCEGRHRQFRVGCRFLLFFFLSSVSFFFFFDSFVELQLQLQLQSLCLVGAWETFLNVITHTHRHTRTPRESHTYTTVKTNSGHLGQASSKLKRLEVVENGRSLRSWKLHSESITF